MDGPWGVCCVLLSLPLCSLQDHMAGEAKSLSPKQCAVMDMALDTIKVSGCGAVVSCGPLWGGWRTSVGGCRFKFSFIHYSSRCRRGDRREQRWGTVVLQTRTTA